jgi:hypothetical protein
MRKPGEVMSQQYLAAAVVFSEVWPILVAHKKKVFVVLVFELWVHSLLWQHLSELKKISDAFPILKSFIGN